ncbi:hypothetical protein [Streptomyces sp. NRRL S-15]|uniref:hypothetical protein n=1 Tax=Streptomyces sp. NRRL S-15 TaxID=1463886 RepID=UPI000AD3922A|nr:hypothetical protein [Streptomyces sp. NRRL S-15]
MSTKPPARLRDGRALTRLGLAAGLVVPAGLLGVPAAIAIPVLSLIQRPACGDPAGEDFPIETRIHGGPDTYAPGGGYGTWYLDLTNTTAESCHSIHPVLVLTDEDRTLTAEQIQLEFTERAHPGEERRVSWESTDRDEQIGVFGSGEQDDDFPGFTVPAKKTVTVEVRMAFTSDTRPGKVTAHAAIVQRRTAQNGAEQAGSPADGDLSLIQVSRRPRTPGPGRRRRAASSPNSPAPARPARTGRAWRPGHWSSPEPPP